MYVSSHTHLLQYKAVFTIKSNPQWGCKVVYGDTDSLFLHYPYATKAYAFKNGMEVADYISKANPHPMKLKFEKVYLPCILLTKKKYVGHMYENPEDLAPTFEAKGIEVIRRDGFPAVQKIMEQCIKFVNLQCFFYIR